MDKSEKTILIVLACVLGGCLLIAMACAGLIFLSQKVVSFFPTDVSPTPQISVDTTCSLPLQSSVDSVAVDQEQVREAETTFATLDATNIPIADLNILTEKLTGVLDIQTQLTTPPVDYEVGDQLDFYVVNGDDENVLIHTTLQYETENVYFWAEDGVYISEYDLADLMDTFAYEIYPTNQAFFGTEWIPGVDNDAHLYIVYATNLGEDLAGYASSTDCVLPVAHPYSNIHEMFYINADVQSLSDPYTLSTMAHEYQHVIHGYRDPNEELWLNESFSELSTLINGYDAGGFDYLFSLEPDMQLNNWDEDPDVNDLNYGASYLFSTYMMGRFGEEITRAVVADPMNGLSSLDEVFTAHNVVDPETGGLMTANEFFRDWTLANYLNDPDLEDGRYFYSSYPEVPMVEDAKWLSDCSGNPLKETVHQYGTDYYEIGCDGQMTLKLKGDDTSKVLPDAGENSTYFIWSNRGDASDMTMTREFDLTNVAGSVIMSFDTWYDLEEDYDYAYLMASVDGEPWELLNSNSCTTQNPNGNNYGCGYNGQTYGWQGDTVDLSRFAGHTVVLRFEYITDGALSTEGFAVDNLSITAINYAEDFEVDDGGWIMEGFSRIKNRIPQTFLVSLITTNSQNSIEKYTLEPGEELTLVIDPGCYDSDPILVVSGSSRYTRELAEYTITLSE